jgi:hypothetical protein
VTVDVRPVVNVIRGQTLAITFLIQNVVVPVELVSHRKTRVAANWTAEKR